LKFLLCQAADTPLGIINCQKSYKLYVEACDYAVAAVLTQMDDGGRDRPVAFASTRLNTAQSSWATVEKEAYAAVWALQKFRWIFCCPVTLFSDHNQLTYITQASPRSWKLMRWALALKEFDVKFDIQRRQEQRCGGLPLASRTTPLVINRMDEHYEAAPG